MEPIVLGVNDNESSRRLDPAHLQDSNLSKRIRGVKTESQSEDEPSGLRQATWPLLQHVLIPTQ